MRGHAMSKSFSAIENPRPHLSFSLTNFFLHVIMLRQLQLHSENKFYIQALLNKNFFSGKESLLLTAYTQFVFFNLFT